MGSIDFFYVNVTIIVMCWNVNSLINSVVILLVFLFL